MRFATMWYVRPTKPQISLRIQSLCLSLEYSIVVKLLTEHHLEFLSLKGDCRGSSVSTLVKMSNCWKSHAPVQLVSFLKHLQNKMASKASTKRTDTNLLRMELLSEFNRLSDIIDHRTQDAEKNRAMLEESYEKIQKRITTIREEVMNELQRLEEATMKIAEKLREKVDGQINKYRTDLEEMNKRYIVMQVYVFCVSSSQCHGWSVIAPFPGHVCCFGENDIEMYLKK